MAKKDFLDFTSATVNFLKKKHFRLTPNCRTKSNSANEQAWRINVNFFPKVVRP